MATGKKAKDIFQSTARKRKPDIGLETAPRTMGRPKAEEPYSKVTVILYDRHVLFLDKVALAIRERTGKIVKRAELVRDLVEYAAARVDPDTKGFEEAARELFTRDTLEK